MKGAHSRYGRGGARGGGMGGGQSGAIRSAIASFRKPTAKIHAAVAVKKYVKN